MQPITKVVILTAGYGEGHNQVSQALQECLERLEPLQVRVVDLFQETYPGLNAFVKFLYRNSRSSSFMGIDYYGWSYHLTNALPESSRLVQWIYSFGSGGLKKLLDRERPDLVIYTFPYAAAYPASTKERPRTATVVTDFAVHKRWLYAKPDWFFVATPAVKETLMQHAVSENRIRVTGIPLRRRFAETKAFVEEKQSVLLMAGGCGTPRMIRRMIRELLLRLPDVRLDVVCGRDHMLKKRLAGEWKDESRVIVHGFTEEMPRLMREAGCIVTKAGGVTLSEAIHAKVPIFILNPSPGQEKENARYLKTAGAAVVASNVMELADEIERLFASPDRLRFIKERIAELRREAPADEVVRHLLTHTERRTTEEPEGAAALRLLRMETNNGNP